MGPTHPWTRALEAAGSSDGLGAAWKFWKRRRHLLTLLAFFGHMFKVILRVNMNVAIVAMTEPHPVSDAGNVTVAYEREFDWDGGTKGLLLSVFFYGYTLTQIPGGILATRLGGHMMFGWGIAFTSVTTLLTPAVARIHLHLLMAVRFAEGLAEGFLSASIELLWGRWVPVHERSRHVAFACSGIPWGDIVGLSVSGLVAVNLGWPAIFYITGACGMVWFLFWWIIVKEHPHLDPHIKPSELEYIQRSLGPTTQDEVRIPFLAILTSLPVWAILVAGMSNCWNHYTFAMHLPTYLNDVMQFDLQQAGLLAAVPYLVEVSVLFAFAHLADTLVNSSYMGVTMIRKTCICGCLVIIAAATLLVGHVHLPTTIMTCLSIVQTFDGVAWSMMLVNQLDIAPCHASILTGLHHAMCSLTGSTGPVLTGYVTQGKIHMCSTPVRKLATVISSQAVTGRGKICTMKTALGTIFACVLGATCFTQTKAAAPSQWSPVISIAQGSLRGVEASTDDNTTYYKFLAIPYAKPPVGPLRFKAPQAPDGWQGVRNATSFGSMCRQRKANYSDEDCLFLNIFTPKLPLGSNDTLLPTMVRIHGGAFVEGSGNVNPGHLLDLGVVVVTINYRLGVFGFLSLEGTDAGGNAGLKDQTTALRWVRDNIAKFGGDPDKVTIYGQSAGGASVHYQVLSPSSAGLFRAAISQSGSALDPWAFRERVDALTVRLGHRLGLSWTSNQQLVDALRTDVHADKLLSVSSSILVESELSMYISEPFVPSLDYPVEGETLFLTDLPRDMEKSGVFHKVPYMAGTNKLESADFVGHDSDMKNSSYWKHIIDRLDRIVPTELGLRRGSAASKDMADRIKDFYFPNVTMSYETRQRWIDLQTDDLFVVGDQRRLHHRLKFAVDTYEYEFSHGRSVHGAEKKYIECGGRTADKPLCRLMSEMWTNFAKRLEPSTAAVEWKPTNDSGRHYLHIDQDGQLVQGVKEAERMDFWLSVYGSLY